MPIDRVRLRLQHILDAMARIERHIAGRDLAAFKADGVLQWLVERGVEIISEATRHIPAHMTDAYPDIEWRDIRGIGNRMRHEYDHLDPFIFWTVAALKLGELKPVIEAMLADLDNKKPS